MAVRFQANAMRSQTGHVAKPARLLPEQSTPSITHSTGAGATEWSESVGPGGPLGGIQWGTAGDGTNIYIASANSNKTSYKLISGEEVTWGFWSAVEASTGKILWQVADPTEGTMDEGALSVANSVVYAGSFDATGHVYALNSSTGKILWSYATGGSVIDGPSIVSSNLFWGSGYHKIPPGTANNKVYDFAPAPAVTVTAAVNGSQVTPPSNLRLPRRVRIVPREWRRCVSTALLA